jgi:hypothetical protein
MGRGHRFKSDRGRFVSGVNSSLAFAAELSIVSGVARDDTEPAMAANGGKKTFLAIVLGGIALLAALVGYVVYGVPVGGDTHHNLTIGMPRPTVPKKAY